MLFRSQFVAPDSFGVFVSIFLFVGLVVGGVSSIGGTLIGAAFIEFVPNLADKVSKAAPGAVYGVILIAVMFLMPAGAGGFLQAMWRKLVRGSSDGTLATDLDPPPAAGPLPFDTASNLQGVGLVAPLQSETDVRGE